MERKLRRGLLGRMLTTGAIACSLLFAYKAPVAAQEVAPEVRPANRIVIMLDRSGSFEKHQQEAKEIAWKFIRDIGNSSPNDEVYVTGVDNHTSQITYIRGVRSRRDARAEFEKAFTHSTNGRGTDFVSGFQIAEKDFAVSPQPGAKYLLVFGDLACDNETDPATGTIIRKFKDITDFDWSVFHGVQISMYFAKDAKRDQLNAIPSFAALGATIYTIESSARAGDITAPRAVRMTDQQNSSTDNSIYMYVSWAIVLIVALIFLSRLPARSS
jgi:hypothetical protein